MGVNNKRRRAAKQRRRTRPQAPSAAPRQPEQPGLPGLPGLPSQSAFRAGDGGEGARRHARAMAVQRVEEAVRGLAGRRVDADELAWRSRTLLRNAGPAAGIVHEVLSFLIVRMIDSLVSGGWDPTDLAELVRRSDEAWLPMLVTGLSDHSLAGGRADDDWRARIDAIGLQRPLEARDSEAVAAGLGLAALLLCAPVLAQDAVRSRRTGASEAEHPKWRQVRTLLAKAESTDFGPEAEALVAKAQELVSRYALERLMESEDSRGADDPEPVRQPVSRRLWLDRPYVRAKSVLVHEVARVNHCRSALAERFGFVLLVGDPADLDAVDLLVTSLMMQAEVAMMRLGRSVGGAGRRARSRAFRQSFLLAYAHRIGERLAQAEQTALAGLAAALPVLLDHDRRVSGAFETMVPHTVGRPVAVGDLAGYDAGIAAADQAVLAVHRPLSPGDV